MEGMPYATPVFNKECGKGFILLSDTASYTDSDAVSDTVFVPATTEIL